MPVERKQAGSKRNSSGSLRMVANTQAWVTLATNDSYCLGAVVLANSLRRSGTTRKIVVMVTANDISEAMMQLLNRTFDEVVSVESLDSQDTAHLELLERPELGITFTKLHCWKLVQYSKCVFLDADTMVVQNSDELFDREEFSAAPDAGWPDCFNSGVFVYVPSHETYAALIKHASSEGSFDGGDQGLLNTFFSEWATKDIHKHLPFLYNMVATATYTYLPAFKKYGQNVKIVHFIGASKPWHASFDQVGQPVPRQSEDKHAIEHLKNWWHIYRSDVVPKMGTASKASPKPVAVKHVTAKGDAPKPEGILAVEKDMSKQAWEQGHPDYRGASSMDNIIKKIETTLAAPESGSKK